MSNTNIIRLNSVDIDLLEQIRRHMMKTNEELEKLTTSEWLKEKCRKDYKEEQEMSYAELTKIAIYYAAARIEEKEKEDF